MAERVSELCPAVTYKQYDAKDLGYLSKGDFKQSVAVRSGFFFASIL